MQASLLAVKSHWPQKVSSCNEIYLGKWKFMLISDLKPKPYIDCVSRVLKVSMGCFMWRKLGFFRVISLCFTHVKCGNIMSGFWEC